MLHEPCRTVGRQSTLLHAVQHGGVSCMGFTNPPLALSGHARQFRAETLCSAKRGKGKGVRGALPHGGQVTFPPLGGGMDTGGDGHGGGGGGTMEC